MEVNQSKGRYVVELISVLGLGFILLLFKLVQPLGWAQVFMPEVWAAFIDQLQYAAIDMLLIVVICCHFIFGRTFAEMGLKDFKKNIGLFLLNGIFIGIYIGAVYFAAQLSKNVSFDGVSIALTIAADFIAAAFVEEIIFRGYLQETCERLFPRKSLVSGLVSSLIVSLLFAATYMPHIIMALENVSGNAVMQALAYPFGLSLYLCLVYHFSCNLWACTAAHGVCLVLADLPGDFFKTIFFGIYLGVMAIYLIVCIVRYYRGSNGQEEAEDTEGWEKEGKSQDEEEEEAPAVAAQMKQTDDSLIGKQGSSEAALIHETLKKEADEEKVDIPYFAEMAAKPSEEEAQDELDQTAAISALDDQDTEATMSMPIVAADEANAASSEDLEKTMIMHAVSETETSEEEDLETTIIMPAAIEEDLEKTMIMPAIKDRPQEKKAGKEDLEQTLVMPAIKETVKEEERRGSSDSLKKIETEMESVEAADMGKAKVIPFTSRGRQVGLQKETHSEKQIRPNELSKSGQKNMARMQIKAEPNFIAHLEKYLGEFDGIFRQMAPTDPPIDIMFFRGKEYNALVTNGMRSLPMERPAELGGSQFAELMMFLDKSIELTDANVEDEENAWLVKLLIDLALFPKETGGYLGAGHIVGNGESLEPYSSVNAYCGALIFPPIEQENVKFYRYVEKGNTIYIYNVMPLFREELRFIQEHSSDQFINLMSEMGVKQIIKRDRINVIQAMKKETE